MSFLVLLTQSQQTRSQIFLSLHQKFPDKLFHFVSLVDGQVLWWLVAVGLLAEDWPLARRGFCFINGFVWCLCTFMI